MVHRQFRYPIGHLPWPRMERSRTHTVQLQPLGRFPFGPGFFSPSCRVDELVDDLVNDLVKPAVEVGDRGGYAMFVFDFVHSLVYLHKRFAESVLFLLSWISAFSPPPAWAFQSFL